MLVSLKVLFYALKNYACELKLYLQEDMSVVWLSYEGHSSVTTQ